MLVREHLVSTSTNIRIRFTEMASLNTFTYFIFFFIHLAQKKTGKLGLRHTFCFYFNIVVQRSKDGQGVPGSLKLLQQHQVSSDLCELWLAILWTLYWGGGQIFVGEDIKIFSFPSDNIPKICDNISIRQISDQPVNSVDWSPDKLGLLATASFDQRLRVVFVTKLNLLWGEKV